MTTIALSKRLYCTDGGSTDKEYRIHLVEAAGGFHVVGMNGRRGGPLKEQPKTKEPVTREAAMKVFEALEREKKRKGYTEDESGVPYALTAMQGQVSGWCAMLPTPISAEEVERFLRDDTIAAQEKQDGERRGAEFLGDELRGINKKGLYVATPATWLPLFAALGADTLLDAEHVGDVLHVFDALKIAGTDVSDLPFAQRWEALAAAMQDVPAGSPVRLVYTATGYESKRRLLQEVRARNGEGLVFRRLDARYTPGEATSAATAVVFKLKFQESATCIVSSVHPTRSSVGLSLLDSDAAEVPVGNVTIPPNHSVPSVGDIVEVRYLHMFENGALYQPVYLGRRTDQDRDDALLSKVQRIKRRERAEEPLLL